MSKVYQDHNEVLKALASGEIDMPTASAILAEMTAAKVAAAKTGGVKAFKISADSPKGVFTITLPGMGMAIAPPAEAVEAIVANIEAIKAAVAKHGDERKQTRAAYKLTPEYKASAAKMFDAASKAKRAAA